MFRMNEFLSISSEEVDFFDIENIDHEHGRKLHCRHEMLMKLRI